MKTKGKKSAEILKETYDIIDEGENIRIKGQFALEIKHEMCLMYPWIECKHKEAKK